MSGELRIEEDDEGVSMGKIKFHLIQHLPDSIMSIGSLEHVNCATWETDNTDVKTMWDESTHRDDTEGELLELLYRHECNERTELRNQCIKLGGSVFTTESRTNKAIYNRLSRYTPQGKFILLEIVAKITISYTPTNITYTKRKEGKKITMQSDTVFGTINSPFGTDEWVLKNIIQPQQTFAGGVNDLFMYQGLSYAGESCYAQHDKCKYGFVSFTDDGALNERLLGRLFTCVGNNEGNIFVLLLVMELVEVRLEAKLFPVYKYLFNNDSPTIKRIPLSKLEAIQYIIPIDNNVCPYTPKVLDRFYIIPAVFLERDRNYQAPLEYGCDAVYASNNATDYLLNNQTSSKLL